MIRAAIIGIGRWGQNLVRAVQGKSEHIAFTAGQTRSPGKAEAFAQANGIALVDDFAAVLADPTVDAVVLATPHSQHDAQIAQAAAAGKHVFVEKPFTLTRAGAEGALVAVEKAGVTLAVGFNRRFHPSVDELRRRLRAGGLGTIGCCIGEHMAFAGLFTPPGGWRAEAGESPAGAMTALGMHTVDLMIDLIGPIAEVHATSTRRGSPHVDDTNSVLVKFAGGATGVFLCSLATASHYRFAVYGAKGMAEVLRPGLDDFRFVPIPENPGGNLIVETTPEVIRTSGFDLLRAELEAFAHAIAGTAAYPVTPDQVLHGVSVFEAIVRSAETGKPVAISP